MVNHFVVDRAGRGPDGQDISPMRMSEARIALGCVAAPQRRPGRGGGMWR